MKTTAYICDCCDNLNREDEVMGLINNPDLFDPLACYKSCVPEKSNIHFCLRMYAESVTDVASRKYNKGKHPEKYAEYVKELSYAFYHSVEYKHRQRTIKDLH